MHMTPLMAIQMSTPRKCLRHSRPSGVKQNTLCNLE